MINYKQIFYLISALWIMSAIVFATTTISDTSSSFSGNLAVDTNTLYVDGANNRVGIGTTSPDKLLQLVGATYPTVRVGTSTSIYADFGWDSVENRAFIGTIGNNKNISIDVTTLFIDGTNNRVGIGTTSPKTALDVVGITTLNTISLSNNYISQLYPPKYYDTDTLLINVSGMSSNGRTLKFEINAFNWATASESSLFIGGCGHDGTTIRKNIQNIGSPISSYNITLSTGTNWCALTFDELTTAKMSLTAKLDFQGFSALTMETNNLD